ncbi:PREDICTED: uncharacterized protein LOC104750427 isoform X2 [Camelina sativa]|uniref:Uncharacterized protein LOC104750427 isoform X2 n=1 Tax=Camelina sativa TaxID=90675 RepID=A0ABM0WFW6_CAMSA|nr:PREDICTED: uncharacterized protein LOC104750427 isoform X2 [Camelina sativa]
MAKTRSNVVEGNPPGRNFRRSNLRPSKKRVGESKRSSQKRSTKRKLMVDSETVDMDPPSDRDEMDPPSDNDDDGYGGIAEETCRDLSVFFGEDGRNDDCEVDEDIGDVYAWDEEKIPDPLSSDEENEEEMRPSEVYREDVDPEELLQLGKTFFDAADFKHACLRYTLKTRYNIKFYRCSSLKMAAKCAATMREDEDPCPWKIYCSYEKSKQKLQINTYVNVHRCEISGESKMLNRSAIADLFSERLRLNPKLKPLEIQAEILREYHLEAKENSCIKAKKKVMKERRKTHEANFDRIWDYQAEVLKKNPGSTFEIETIPGTTVGSKQRVW